MNFLDDARVALVKDKPNYPKKPPYHPSEKLPEWSELPIADEDNPVYRSVRQLFYYLQLDIENYGKPTWNPLGKIIQPGNIVVIKPNLVSHRNLGEKGYGLTDTDSLITHGSVIRAVLDYAAKALQTHGKIIIGDCPIQGTSWKQIIDLLKLEEIQLYFKASFPHVELIIKDYRLGKAITKGDLIVERVVDEGRIADYQEVDLQEDSLLIPLMKDKWEFGVGQYPKHRMRKAHTPETNKYLFPKDFIYADVIINLPKMKSHMKAGITCALKNLVGINGHKDYLPHFCFGSPKNAGDEYPDGNWLWDLMWFFIHWEWELDKGYFKRGLSDLTGICAVCLHIFYGMPKDAACVGGGGWYGNDTLWRTILDINRAFFYYDRQLQCVNTKLSSDVRYFAILDGLIAGEKESPLAPSPVFNGVMMAAYNPLAMDAVATAMMGFDIQKIKQITGGFSLQTLPIANFSLEAIELVGNTNATNIDDIYDKKLYLPFVASRGFKGYVEYESTQKRQVEIAN